MQTVHEKPVTSADAVHVLGDVYSLSLQAMLFPEDCDKVMQEMRERIAPHLPAQPVAVPDIEAEND